MTDNEIIKALECCFVNANCNGCPLVSPPKEKCLERACHNALLLINRQKAEIEELRNSFAISREEAKKYQRGCRKIKIEASQEFVKRFEKKIKDVAFTLGQTWELQCALRAVLKEMTGGE